MRKVTVLFKPNAKYPDSTYAFAQPKFAFASKFEGGKVRLLSSFHACREYVCQDFLKRMRNSYSSNTWMSEIDTKRVRLVIWTQSKAVKDKQEVHDRKMKNVVKVLNLIEKKVKWPLTKVYTLVNKDKGDQALMSMLVGSGKWLRSQHMLSLYSLFIRSVYMLPNFNRIRTMSGLKKVMAKYKANAYSNVSGNQQSTDISWLKKFDEFMAILGSFDTIYKGLPMSKNYSTKALGSQDDCFCDGISMLIGTGGKHTVLKNRVKKVIKKR